MIALLADPGDEGLVVGPMPPGLFAVARVLGVKLVRVEADAVSMYEAIAARTRFLVLAEAHLDPEELAAFALPLVLLDAEARTPREVLSLRLLEGGVVCEGPEAAEASRRHAALSDLFARS